MKPASTAEAMHFHDEECNIIPLSQRFTGSAPLYRSDSFHVKFDGLQRIHVA